MSNHGCFLAAIFWIGMTCLAIAIFYTVVCVAWWAICWLFHLTFDFVTPLVIAILLEALTIIVNLFRKSND